MIQEKRHLAAKTDHVTSILLHNSAVERVIEKLTIAHDYKLDVACSNAHIFIEYKRHLAVFLTLIDHVTSIFLNNSVAVRVIEKFTLAHD